jgi:hypothetical protein
MVRLPGLLTGGRGVDVVGKSMRGCLQQFEFSTFQPLSPSMPRVIDKAMVACR